MSKDGVQLRNFAEMRAMLKQLEGKEWRKVMRKGVRAGSAVWRDAMKKNARVALRKRTIRKYGPLKRSIKVITPVFEGNEVVGGVTGAYYGILVERGHRLVKFSGYEQGVQRAHPRRSRDGRTIKVMGPYTSIRRRRVVVGRAPPYPWIKPAVASTGDRANEAVMEKLGEELDKIFSKAK